MPTLPLTLLVIMYNEAAGIARCLDSVPFAAEKIVVDSGSDDGTVDIARGCGAALPSIPSATPPRAASSDCRAAP